MVNDPAVARAELEGDDLLVAIERQRDDERPEHVVAAGGDGERLGDLEDVVRLAELPAFGELRRGRQVGPVPFRSAGLGPAGQDRELAIGQAEVIEKDPEPGCGFHGGIRRLAVISRRNSARLAASR